MRWLSILTAALLSLSATQTWAFTPAAYEDSRKSEDPFQRGFSQGYVVGVLEMLVMTRNLQGWLFTPGTNRPLACMGRDVQFTTSSLEQLFDEEIGRFAPVYEEQYGPNWKTRGDMTLILYAALQRRYPCKPGARGWG
jgi:hypothetical protein